MRLFPRISQPTLESFRRDVYRPRLALLLLILLLNGEFPGSTSIATGATLSTGSTSAQTPAASPSSSHGSAAAAWAQWAKSELPFAFRQTTEQAKLKKGSTGKRQRKSPAKAAKASVTAAAAKGEKRQRKSKASTNTSPFQMSTLSIESLFQTQVLSAIVPLHGLWLIRLGGMMIEDSIIKSHSHTRAASGGRSQASSLAAIVGLALLAIAVPLLPSSQMFRSALSFLRSSTVEEEKRSVLPIRAILLLELSATLLSLLCPLMKLNNSFLSKYLPAKVLLPSPSHSPPIVELLPLPPGLADIISGRASDVQAGRGRVGGRRGMAAATTRPGAAALVLGTVRHGGLGGVATADGVADEPPTEGQDQRNPARWVNGMQAPLTLPENASAPDGTPLTKAPRRTGVKVEVDASWLLENVVILWGAFVGAVEYLLVVVSLPSLTPASFPPVVALLSLRSQISAMTLTWTSSRRAVECLEFVRRRWVATTSTSSEANTLATAPSTATTPSSSSSPATTTRRWQPDQHDDVSCPICFELIRSSSAAQEADERVGAESCRLDCGHELHAVCLVQIFLGNKQAYCPCCHDPLKATPPNAQAGGAGADDMVVATAAA